MTDATGVGTMKQWHARALTALLVIGVAGSACAQLKVDTVATLTGKSPENLFYGADGAIYVASAASRELLRCDGGQCATFASLPMKPINLVRGRAGFVADGPSRDRSAPAGADPFASLHGSGKIAAIDRKGVVTKVMDLGSLPNGMVHLGRDIYLVADSVDAVIYRVDMKRGTATTWLADDRFRFVAGGGRGPGVNGAKLRNGTLYLANSSAGALYTIRVGRDGKPAGALTKLADVREADDFDVARDGTVYVATHGPVVKVAPDGHTSELTDGKQMPGGPAVMLARDEKSLYAVTDAVPGGPFLLRLWLQ